MGLSKGGASWRLGLLPPSQFFAMFPTPPGMRMRSCYVYMALKLNQILTCRFSLIHAFCLISRDPLFVSKCCFQVITVFKCDGGAIPYLSPLTYWSDNSHPLRTSSPLPQPLCAPRGNQVGPAGRHSHLLESKRPCVVTHTPGLVNQTLLTAPRLTDTGCISSGGKRPLGCGGNIGLLCSHLGEGALSVSFSVSLSPCCILSKNEKMGRDIWLLWPIIGDCLEQRRQNSKPLPPSQEWNLAFHRDSFWNMQRNKLSIMHYEIIKYYYSDLWVSRSPSWAI